MEQATGSANVIIRELYELLTSLERHDFETATDDELIDAKRELKRAVLDIETHLIRRQEEKNAK